MKTNRIILKNLKKQILNIKKPEKLPKIQHKDQKSKNQILMLQNFSLKLRTMKKNFLKTSFTYILKCPKKNVQV